MVTMEQLKQLREMTGISMMQCKKALEESGGDIQGALAYLKEKGIEIAAKKSERELGAGIIQSYIHSNGSVGALVELNCETDFVARNEEFKALAYDIAMHITATNPTHVSPDKISDEVKQATREILAKESPDVKEEILQGKVDSYLSERTLTSQSFVKNPDETIGSLINNKIQKFGEKIEVGRFVRFSLFDK